MTSIKEGEKMKKNYKSLLTVFLSMMAVHFTVVSAHSNQFIKNPWTAFPGSFRLTPAFPDKASRYDVFSFKPGTGDFDMLKVTGQFPYARYFSINLYDYNEATDFASLSDREIEADDGSINPYEIGADRGKKNRSYTLWIMKEGTIPPAEAGNILTYPGGIETLTLMTRVYRPDQGCDSLGSVSQPTVELIKLDGSKGDPPDMPNVLTGIASKLEMFLFNPDLIATVDILKQFAGNKIVFHRISDAGLFPNAHNEYVVSPLETRYWNNVAVVTLKAVPTFEETYHGDSFEGEKEVRYWSLCTGGMGATTTPACLCDDEITPNEDGTVTVVIAPSYLKSMIKNAGLNYMAWGLVYKPVLIYRHMMARDDFEGKIGNVTPIERPPAMKDRNKEYLDDHRAENWMGDYAPRGFLYSISEFKKMLSQGKFHTAFD